MLTLVGCSVCVRRMLHNFQQNLGTEYFGPLYDYLQGPRFRDAVPTPVQNIVNHKRGSAVRNDDGGNADGPGDH